MEVFHRKCLSHPSHSALQLGVTLSCCNWVASLRSQRGAGCRDGDHRLTKGDVLGAIGPLMCVAQAGVVFKGTAEEDSRKAASVWDDFRDSMRELATDKVAAAIATGAYDEVDAHRTGRIQGGQCSEQCMQKMTVRW